jgi:hypothetical protein
MSSSEVKNIVSNQNENLQKLLQTFKDIDSLIAPTDSALSVEGTNYNFLAVTQFTLFKHKTQRGVYDFL